MKEIFNFPKRVKASWFELWGDTQELEKLGAEPLPLVEGVTVQSGPLTLIVAPIALVVAVGHYFTFYPAQKFLRWAKNRKKN